MTNEAQATQTETTLGVEIEFLMPSNISLLATQNQVAAALTAAGVPTGAESYNHAPPGAAWKIVTDGSVKKAGHYGLELVSNILTLADQHKIETVCQVIRAMGGVVNTTCGIHVHVGVKTWEWSKVRNFWALWHSYEPAILACMSASRRNNIYCRPLPVTVNWARHLSKAGSVRSLSTALGTRYTTLNIESYFRHGTLEARCHGGSLDAVKITAWMRLIAEIARLAQIDTTRRLMRGAVSVNLERAMGWLTSDMPAGDKSFWINRMATLNGTTATNETEG